MRARRVCVCSRGGYASAVPLRAQEPEDAAHEHGRTSVAQPYVFVLGGGGGALPALEDLRLYGIPASYAAKAAVKQVAEDHGRVGEQCVFC